MPAGGSTRTASPLSASVSRYAFVGMGPAGRAWTFTPQTENIPPPPQPRKFTFTFGRPADTDTRLCHADPEVRRPPWRLYRARGDVRGPAGPPARGPPGGAHPRPHPCRRGRGGDRQPWQGLA